MESLLTSGGHVIVAITRQVSRSMQACELTYLEREPINLALARRQHKQYEQTLAGLGLEVICLPEEPHLPDAVFVEDTAVVLNECAVITIPGAVSRRPETKSIAEVLVQYRELSFIQPPGTLDGGDVLCVGRNIYVGLTLRSNFSAIEQLHTMLKPYGYQVTNVSVSGCLHLKSAVGLVAERTLLINPAWIDKDQFSDVSFVEVDSSEPYAANTLLIDGVVIYVDAYPKTRQRLGMVGIHALPVDFSEFVKAEGALTCCSLILEV